MFVSHGSIISLFPLGGYSLLDVSSTLQEELDVREYTLHLCKDSEHSLSFTLPEPDEEGVLSIGETFKVVISRAVRGTNYEIGPPSLKNVWVHSPADVVLSMLKDALRLTLTHDLDPELLQGRIDGFFASSKLTRLVDPDKPIDMEMAVDTILVDVATNPVDYRQRTYEDWEGRVDLVTTPTGRFVGQLFRKAKDATVNKGRLVASGNLFSRSSEKYFIFPENDRPDRLLMTRSILARHEEVVVPEQPMVAHKLYDGKLKGVHLLTAIAAWPCNYFDSIAASESAAAKLACKKTTRQVVIDNKPYEMCVSEGQFVEPGDRLLVSASRTIYASKIRLRSILTQVKQAATMVGRVPSTKYIFTFSTTIPASVGTKISGRHGNKGVLVVLPDSQMPVVTYQGKAVTLDILIHPRSLVGRRNLGVLREMMANAKCQDKDCILRTEHFSDGWSMRQLVDEGYGELREATVDGEPVGEVFCGPLYWLRTDKHAIDACQSVGKDKPVDQRGLNPDRGTSGQRLGPDVALVMDAKGLSTTLDYMMREAVEPAAIEQAGRILSCLE